MEDLIKLEDAIKSELMTLKRKESAATDFNQKLTFKGEIVGLTKSLELVRQLTAPQG